LRVGICTGSFCFALGIHDVVGRALNPQTIFGNVAAMPPYVVNKQSPIRSWNALVCWEIVYAIAPTRHD
jgi:hypothetical protein